MTTIDKCMSKVKIAIANAACKEVIQNVLFEIDLENEV